MPKVITSPVALFPGTVTLYEPLPWPVMMAWSRAVQAAPKYEDDRDEYLNHMLPGVIACVQSWNLRPASLNGVEPTHYTAETFPGSPKLEAMLLLAWLLGEAAQIALGEQFFPNASRPAPTPTPKATGRRQKN